MANRPLLAALGAGKPPTSDPPERSIPSGPTQGVSASASTYPTTAKTSIQSFSHRSHWKIKFALSHRWLQWKEPFPRGLSRSAVPAVHWTARTLSSDRASERQGLRSWRHSVPNPEQFSSLIGDIYDAAMEPGLWPGVLAQIASFVGGSAAAFYSKDAATKTGDVHYDCGASDPHFKRLYFGRYIQIDPTLAGPCFAPIGEPVTTADVVDYNEFLASRFYREWVRPQGLVDNVSVALEKSATGTALLGVFRHKRQGLADDEARRRMRLIAPHVRRAALAARAMAHKSAEAATLADTVDGLSAGVFLVDASARIVHANAAGQTILPEGTVQRSSNGTLVAADRNAARVLGDVLERSQSGDRTLKIRAVAVPVPGRDGESYIAHVLALTSPARRAVAEGYAAAAAVLVQKASLRSEER